MHEGGFDAKPDVGLNPFNGLDQAQIPSAKDGQPQFQDPFSIGGPGQGFTFGHTGQMSTSQQPYARQIPCQEGYDPYENEDGEMESQNFDPDAEWGKPMGLPSPPPPEEKGATNGPMKNGMPNGKTAVGDKTSKAANGAAKGTTTTTTKKTTSSTTKKVTEKEKASKTALSKTTKNSQVTKTETVSKSEKMNTSRLETTKSTTVKGRPASAAAAVSEPKTKPPAGRRPATATGSTRLSPAPKMPPLPPLTPFYFDLAYIPHHGDPAYCNVEYFKRVRARYYVYSSLSTNPATLNALLEGKAAWENKDLQVTLYPTYDNDTLRHWMALNDQKLNDLKIEIAAPVSRCILHLQDSETSCQALKVGIS